MKTYALGIRAGYSFPISTSKTSYSLEVSAAKHTSTQTLENSKQRKRYGKLKIKYSNLERCIQDYGYLGGLGFAYAYQLEKTTLNSNTVIANKKNYEQQYLPFLVLISSFGIPLDMHFCRGVLKVYTFGEAKSCHTIPKIEQNKIHCVVFSTKCNLQNQSKTPLLKRKHVVAMHT